MALLACFVAFEMVRERVADYRPEVYFSPEGVHPDLFNELGASYGCDLDVRMGDTLREASQRLRACQDTARSPLAP
jgi:hypothetical protein